FKNTFNPNSFTKSFSNLGGANLPEDILALLGDIYSASTNSDHKTDIGYYLFTFMRKLLNNRVGTYLSDLEIKNVRKDDAKPFETGQILVNEVQNETYKFVIFVESIDREATILTKEDTKNDIINKKVPRDTLYNYSRYDTIIQNYKLTESNLIDED